MPEYANSNGLDAYEKLPGFYWDGKTDLNCLKEAITPQNKLHTRTTFKDLMSLAILPCSRA